MRLLFCCLTLILCIGCSNKNNERKDNASDYKPPSFLNLDCAKMMKDNNEVPVSIFADSINYVPLETTPSSLIGRIYDAQFTKDYIFIEHNAGQLTQFDRNGKFIRHIGKIGRGPEEYNGMRAFSVNEAKRLIYIQSNWIRKLVVYSFDGNFVKSIDLKLDDKQIVWSRDSLFMCFSEPQTGNEDYVFREIDSSGKIIQSVKNYCTWEDQAPFGQSIIYFGRNIFYRFNNKLHFKGEFNDTVYTFDQNLKIIPKYNIDLKEYKLPAARRIERGNRKPFTQDFYWVCAKETSKFIFLRFSTYIANVTDSWALDEGYICFDKTTGNYNTIHNKNEESGFINDLDGGPNFIPEYTNDSLAFHFTKAKNMVKHISTDNFINATSKYPRKKEMILKQFAQLNESDNDILVVARLK